MGKPAYEMSEIGKNITSYRKGRGLSQQALAENAGINYRHYQNIEGGRVDPRLSTLEKIAEQLDTSVAALTSLRSLTDQAKSNGKRLRRILEFVPVGIQMNDLSGLITFSNPAHRRLHGYPDKELIGKKYIWDLVARPAQRIELERYFRRLPHGKIKPTPYFTTNRRKDGTSVDVRVDWRYLHDSKGNVEGFISAIRPDHPRS